MNILSNSCGHFKLNLLVGSYESKWLIILCLIRPRFRKSIVIGRPHLPSLNRFYGDSILKRRVYNNHIIFLYMIYKSRVNSKLTHEVCGYIGYNVFFIQMSYSYVKCSCGKKDFVKIPIGQTLEQLMNRKLCTHCRRRGEWKSLPWNHGQFDSIKKTYPAK